MRMIETRRARAGLLGAFIAFAVLAPESFPGARADSIYDVTGAGSNDFVPFENDGTPNRPFGVGWAMRSPLAVPPAI
jgi:hypothetical protein